jgi:hypothetical protein
MNCRSGDEGNGHAGDFDRATPTALGKFYAGWDAEPFRLRRTDAVRVLVRVMCSAAPIGVTSEI